MLRKVIAVIGSLFLLTGCASTESDSGFSRQDLMFAEMMIPHHQQAILISDLALENSTNPKILDLANRIKSAQAPEIEQMKSWPEVDTSSHMGHMMSGMLSENELAELRAARGADFDRLFLLGMIKHHEGAIDMAEMVSDSNNLEVATLAKAIIAAQRGEIEEMQALLD